MKKIFVPLLLISLLVIGTVQAQDDTGLTQEQREMLTFVNSAIDNLNALDSYSITSETNQMNITCYEASLCFNSLTDLSYEIRARFESGGQPEAAQGTNTLRRVQLQQSERSDYYVESSFVLVDDLLYQRADMSRLPYFLSENFIPEGWLVLSTEDLQAMTANEYGYQFLTFQSLMMPLVTLGRDEQFQVQGIAAPFDESLVLDIVEQEGDEENGQWMRVFQIKADPFQTAITQTAGSIEMPDSETSQALGDMFRESQVIQIQIWIGEDDLLPHRIVTAQGGKYDTGEMRKAIPALEGTGIWPDKNITFISSSYITTTYDGFGMPFMIDAPPGAIPFKEWATLDR